MRGPSSFNRFGFRACSSVQAACASASNSGVCIVECFARVRSCICCNRSVNCKRMRSMSEFRPATKSPQGGKFLKAVIAKDSERVHATNGKPCFEAGLNLLPPAKWITTPSLIVKPCALFTVKAYPPDNGNCSTTNYTNCTTTTNYELHYKLLIRTTNYTNYTNKIIR